MNCNFFNPVQICNISEDMKKNIHILSRLDDEKEKKNLFDPRPVSTRCCNYLNKSYNNLPSSCCYSRPDNSICSINMCELNKLKNNNNYKGIISDNSLISKEYANIDFEVSKKGNEIHEIKNIKDIPDNNIYKNFNISENFDLDINNRQIFNKQTKKKLIN